MDGDDGVRLSLFTLNPFPSSPSMTSAPTPLYAQC
ncbi:hypothetical protein GLYMA_11G163410v4 [Glycine max]|nr:hypothetical protein GLYMA_11G163410v4 [Glycine max]KAH1115867.1 hypothetical protein GYH30_057147 [Glycine max]